jgi:hypothetical protein
MPGDNEFWLQNPVATNFLVTSRFNDPRDYGNGLHEGIDLNAVDSSGSPVAVLAAQRGVVDKVGFYQSGYGNYLRIRHAWPDGATYVTWYGHLSSISVKQGDFVQIGQKVGIAGATGNAEGIHLHLTLQVIGHGLQGYVVDDVVDPLPFFRFGVQPTTNEAQFVSDVTIPDGTSIKPGTAFVKTWRIRNSGTKPWITGYQLAYFAQEHMSAIETVPLPPTAPGQETEVTVNLVASARLGRMRSTWKGRDPNGVFFEFPLWAEIVVAGSPDEDGAVFISDVNVPPNTTVPADKTFLKQWRVKNTGTTTWGSSYSLAYFSDEKLGAPDSITLPKTAPGEEAVLGITFKAPAAPGSYRSTWRLRDNQGQEFGEPLYVLIQVAGQGPGSQKNELSFVCDVTFEDGSVVSPGQVIQKVWRVRNTGNTPWNNGYSLVFVADEQMGGPAQVQLPITNPGDTVDIPVTLVAPSSQGQHRSTWQPRDPQGNLFDHVLFLLVEVAPVVQPGDLVDDAKFEADISIPDGTVIQAGKPFQKIWRIRNTGTTTWSAGYKLVFVKDTPMTSILNLPVSQVGPGEITDITVNLTAPLTPGKYQSTWRMCNPQGQNFGHELFAIIRVPSAQPVVYDNRAVFISHETFEPGAFVSPGQQFDKVWVVRNIGKSAWSEGYTLAYLDGEKMAGPDSVAVPFTESQRTVRLSVSLVAPSAKGYYKGYWKLRDPRGTFFGPRLPVWINVK